MTNDFLTKATEFSRDFELAYNKCDIEFIEKTNNVFLKSEYDETVKAIEEEDIVEIIDGFADQAFIALNGIYKMFRMRGYEHDAASVMVGVVMNRVCNANLSKRNEDGTITYEGGKVQKPKTFKAPEYWDLI